MKVNGPGIPWQAAPPLRALASFPDNSPIPYIAYNELHLPASMDFDNHVGSRMAVQAMNSAFNSFSRLPSALGSSASRWESSRSIDDSSWEGQGMGRAGSLRDR